LLLPKEMHLIYDNVLPETTIHSDLWRAYTRVNNLLTRNYNHLTVNHELYFKDPITVVHTNSIESLWNSGKIHMKNMRGVKRQYHQSYLDEFCYLNNTNIENPINIINPNSFSKIIESILKLYPTNRNATLSDQLLNPLTIDIEEENDVQEIFEVEDEVELEFEDYANGDNSVIVELEDGNIEDFGKVSGNANSTFIDIEYPVFVDEIQIKDKAKDKDKKI
jgi:hypothetical protein